MFDTFVTRQEHVTRNINVTEKRAPTDESIRLLREMEKAAQSQVLQATRTTDNNFDCIIQTAFDSQTGDDILCAIFSLNGDKKKVQYRRKYSDSPEDSIIGLRDEIAKEIANQVAHSVNYFTLATLNLKA